MGDGGFIPSINVDSCIIEEQEEHLVIALRIPKSLIASNMSFLAALAKRCGDDNRRVWSTRSDPPLRSNRWLAIGSDKCSASLLVFLLVPTKQKSKMIRYIN